MKALFCTDGSEISFNAIKNFSKYSKQFVVDIICVIDWHFYPMYTQSPQQNYQETYDEIADKILNLAQNCVNQTGNIVESKIKAFGNIAEEILKQTKKREYDLIILGSHGKKGLRSWLGSVSREVINTTKKNIFVSKTDTSGKKILFTTDGSEYSQLVIKKALELLDMVECSVYTIYVENDLNNIPVELKTNKAWLDKIVERQKKEREQVLKKLKDIFSSKNIQIKREITLIGEPAEKILEITKEIDLDLIDVGPHSKNMLERIYLLAQ